MKNVEYVLRVIVCSAADLYIKDYFHPYVANGHKEATPLRIYYRHRWVQTVHPTVIQYALLSVGETGRFFRRPTKEDVDEHRIIVATLSTSRDLYNLQMGAGQISLKKCFLCKFKQRSNFFFIVCKTQTFAYII